MSDHSEPDNAAIGIRQLDSEEERRFWSKVAKSGADECWEWTGATDRDGYGHFQVDEIRQAHRVAFRIRHEDPGDNWVLHHCDNPRCVNPDHLYLGGQSENMKDAFDRGRVSQSGESNAHAKLDEDDVIEILELLDQSDVTQQEIAENYGVGSSTIAMINSGENWSYLVQEYRGGGLE